MKHIKQFEKFNSFDQEEELNPSIPKEVVDNVNDILLDLKDEYNVGLDYYHDDEWVYNILGNKSNTWHDFQNTKVPIDKIESINVVISCFGNKQPNGSSDLYLENPDVWKQNKEKYINVVKDVLNHLYSYVKSIDYNIILHHENDIIYKGFGRKKIEIPRDYPNMNNFIDYVMWQGGDISFCLNPKK